DYYCQSSDSWLSAQLF
nr:immunoglobulin light chain junction region [Macaca mulatta]